MRLWSLHPKYLDRQGLLAVWREGLLAQKVLQGGTKGYWAHSQLLRFKEQKDQLAAIGRYLGAIYNESLARGYKFDQGKILSHKSGPRIKVARGQVEYEFLHLLNKLKRRDPRRYARQRREGKIAVHPLFRMTAGPVEGWEKLR
jgi:hypothetical protein